METIEIEKIKTFQTYGNKKLLDCVVNGVSYKYAQFNTRAVVDCPFATSGCRIACYATHGCHRFPSVKKSREQAYQETLDKNFSIRMIYTIECALESKRYKGSTMILRLHESGDFYSIEYLRKWLNIFKHFSEHKNIIFCFYTKSFKFFKQLEKEEFNALKELIAKGVVAMSVSLDDTSTAMSLMDAAYLQATLHVNSYIATTNPDNWKYNAECRCKNCAECGNCIRATKKNVVCRLHSVSDKEITEYEKLKLNQNGSIKK